MTSLIVEEPLLNPEKVLVFPAYDKIGSGNLRGALTRLRRGREAWLAMHTAGSPVK